MPDNTCAVIANEVPNCCESALDCDDGNSVTVDSCPGPGESCLYITDNTACPQNVVFLESNFDDGTPQGWNIQQYEGVDIVDWHVSSRRAADGELQARFGHKECPTYYTEEMTASCELTLAGESNSLPTYTAAISPEMNLLSDTVVLMRAKVWADMEYLGLDADDPLEQFFDNVFMKVEYTEETDGTFNTVSVPLWGTPDVQKDTGGVFLEIGADLSAYAGKVIRIVLEARADDGNNFGFEGFYVDSIQVKTGCGSILGCAGAADCVSANPCITASCVDLVNTNGAACFGVKSSPACSPCLTGQDFECNDFDSCTIDACIGQTCSYETDIACCEDEATWGHWTSRKGNCLRGGLCRTP